MDKIIFYSINLISLIIIVFVIYVFIPTIVKYYLRSRFLNRIAKSDSVYFTFDDGPSPRTTLEIVSLLEEYNIKATFFLLGQNVDKYPYVVEQIKRSGHSIGEHSYEHTHPWFTGPFKSFKDLLNGKRIVYKYLTTGEKVLFRPPYGKLNLVTLLYVLIYRRNIAFWNIDPKDYFNKNENDISSYVLNRLKSGTVVLFHDNNLYKGSTSKEIVGALRIILENTKGGRIKFSSL